jgi:prephenate dehydrogenase/chorismate mutase
VSTRRPGLARLRDRIDEADRAIARAIGRRLDLAAQVGRTKFHTNTPLRDYATEDRVLARWNERLAVVGVERTRSTALARWLIEESLRVQESVPPGPRTRRTSGQRVGVIGGAGSMGRWLVSFLTDAGHDVYVVDPRADPRSRRTLPTVDDAMSRCDIVAFATPIRATAPVLERALERPGDTVVFDILSVKAPIEPILREARRKGRRVTSTHPMFGPSARTLSGRNLLLVSCGASEADRVVRGLFGHSALTITEVPIERHDPLVAESLGLAHAVNLLFLSALASDPLTSHDIAAAASTTFHRQSTLADAVAREGPELYLDIQSLNPHSTAVYGELRAALDRLEGVVGRRDLRGFEEIIREGRSKLQTGPEPVGA